MTSPISHFTALEKKELFEALNYLNMEEITKLCKARGISFTIFAEDFSGEIVNTREKDRKGIVLARMKHYLKTGKVQAPTTFKKAIVRLNQKLDDPKSTDKIYYNVYDKKNKALMNLLKRLTDDEYKDGAIARILLREFWTSGKAPTIKEFASAWKKAKREHIAPNEEWAFLADRSKGKDTSEWKKVRLEKAKFVIKTLQKLS